MHPRDKGVVMQRSTKIESQAGNDRVGTEAHCKSHYLLILAFKICQYEKTRCKCPFPSIIEVK